MLNPLDREALRRQFESNRPYPHFFVENFLQPEAVKAVAAAYPDFESAARMGLQFKAVNEQRKVQICDSSKFPDPVRQLGEIISGPEFLNDLEYITGIPKLLADEKFEGGGMHVTGAGGRLDVHVDFNFQTERKLHRRLNILLYLNEGWQAGWGGEIELWDKDVKTLLKSMAPIMNRCLVFETTEISFHGVRPVTAPASVCRRSFAGYYYTTEPPAHWDGKVHDTIFHARPDEHLRGMVLMPAEKLRERLRQIARGAARRVKKVILGA